MYPEQNQRTFRITTPEALGSMPTINAAQEVPKRQSEIQELLTDALGGVERTLTRISRLENRLSSVLTQIAVDPNKDLPESPPKTKLAEILRELIRRIDSANNRLTDITDRCDLPE